MTGTRSAPSAIRPHRYRALLVVALAAGLVLAQCGGGSDQPAIEEGGAPTTVPAGGGGDSAQSARGDSRQGGGAQAAPTRGKLRPQLLVACRPAETGGAATGTTATTATTAKATASCTVTNEAEVPVSGVTLELDGDLATVARPDTGTCRRVGGRLLCNLGTLQPGQSVATLVEASPQAAGRAGRVRAGGARRGGAREEGEAQMVLAR